MLIDKVENKSKKRICFVRSVGFSLVHVANNTYIEYFEGQMRVKKQILYLLLLFIDLSK